MTPWEEVFLRSLKDITITEAKDILTTPDVAAKVCTLTFLWFWFSLVFYFAVQDSEVVWRSKCRSLLTPVIYLIIVNCTIVYRILLFIEAVSCAYDNLIGAVC